MVGAFDNSAFKQMVYKKLLVKIELFSKILDWLSPKYTWKKLLKTMHILFNKNLLLYNKCKKITEVQWNSIQCFYNECM
jgi:hypothetical protein